MGFQITRGKREQRGKMPACGMAAHVNAVRVTPILSDVPDGPREGCGDVLNLRRVRVFRSQSVARHDRQDASLRETVAERQVLGPVARTPRAAMNEQENRREFFVLGQIQIELVFVGIGRLAVGVFQVRLHFDV